MVFSGAGDFALSRTSASQVMLLRDFAFGLLPDDPPDSRASFFSSAEVEVGSPSTGVLKSDCSRYQYSLHGLWRYPITAKLGYAGHSERKSWVWTFDSKAVSSDSDAGGEY